MGGGAVGGEEDGGEGGRGAVARARAPVEGERGEGLRVGSMPGVGSGDHRMGCRRRGVLGPAPPPPMRSKQRVLTLHLRSFL